MKHIKTFTQLFESFEDMRPEDHPETSHGPAGKEVWVGNGDHESYKDLYTFGSEDEARENSGDDRFYVQLDDKEFHAVYFDDEGIGVQGYDSEEELARVIGDGFFGEPMDFETVKRYANDSEADGDSSSKLVIFQNKEAVTQ